jgi:hypothetical protein
MLQALGPEGTDPTFLRFLEWGAYVMLADKPFAIAYMYFIGGLCALCQNWTPFLMSINFSVEGLLAFFPSPDPSEGQPGCDSQLALIALELAHHLWDHQFRNGMPFDVGAALTCVAPFAVMSTSHARHLTFVLETFIHYVLPDDEYTFISPVCSIMLAIIERRTSGELNGRVSTIATEMLRLGCDATVIGDQGFFRTLLQQLGVTERRDCSNFPPQVFDLIATVFEGTPEEDREPLLSGITPFGLLAILTGDNCQIRKACLRTVSLFVRWGLSIGSFFVHSDVLAHLASYLIADQDSFSARILWFEFCHALCVSYPRECVALFSAPPDIESLNQTELYRWHMEQEALKDGDEAGPMDQDGDEQGPRHQDVDEGGQKDQLSPWCVLSYAELFLFLSDLISDEDLAGRCIDLILRILPSPAEGLYLLYPVVDALAECPDLLELIRETLEQYDGNGWDRELIENARAVFDCFQEALG